MQFSKSLSISPWSTSYWEPISLRKQTWIQSRMLKQIETLNRFGKSLQVYIQSILKANQMKQDSQCSLDLKLRIKFQWTKGCSWLNLEVTSIPFLSQSSLLKKSKEQVWTNLASLVPLSRIRHPKYTVKKRHKLRLKPLKSSMDVQFS